MNQPLELQTLPVTAPQTQGTLFALAMLPRQPRAYKELEEEFLPPRDQKLMQRTQH